MSAKGARKAIDDPQRGWRLARTIVSDINLYNEPAIVAGIENDDLFAALAEQLAEGREHFKSRVSEEVLALNIYDRAVVDGLLGKKGHLKSKIW